MIDYAKTFNENMLVVVVIETSTGVANAYDIASATGVDVVSIGSTRLGVFSGFPQDDDRHQAIVKKVRDGTLHGQDHLPCQRQLRQGLSAQWRREVLPERPIKRWMEADCRREFQCFAAGGGR